MNIGEDIRLREQFETKSSVEELSKSVQVTPNTVNTCQTTCAICPELWLLQLLWALYVHYNFYDYLWHKNRVLWCACNHFSLIQTMDIIQLVLPEPPPTLCSSSWSCLENLIPDLWTIVGVICSFITHYTAIQLSGTSRPWIQEIENIRWMYHDWI
jgi:hypothetical protein